MTACEICRTEKITDKVEKYSKEKFNKVLCFDCQKKSKEPQQTEVVEPQQYDPAFLGMCLNQAWANAREYEKTYEEVRGNIDKYFEDCLKVAVKLMNCRNI